MLVAACASVFALGETLMQPTIPALVNDLAPDHLRGRYNALSSAAFQLAAIVAPPISGALVGHGLGSVYIGVLVVGSLAVGAFAVAPARAAAAARGQRRPACPTEQPPQRSPARPRPGGRLLASRTSPGPAAPSRRGSARRPRWRASARR